MAADTGHVDSMLMVGLFYLFGFEPVTLDDEEGIHWLIKAAQITGDLDIDHAKPAAIEYYNLIEDSNAESKEEFFSSLVKKWKSIDPKTVVIM